MECCLGPLKTQASDAILTADQGIRYQQNRATSRVALIVLSDNDEKLLLASVDAISAAIRKVEPGALIWVDLNTGA